MLPKNYRLKKKKDFKEVVEKGKGLKKDFLILKFIKNDLKTTRIGFAVGQKVSKKATLRNKIKRRLREAVNLLSAKIKSGYDLVFFAKKGSEEKSFSEIKEKVGEILTKAKLLKDA